MLRRYLRLVRGLEASVSPDLRGWSWDREPVAPSYPVRISVHEISNRYCESGRDIYLRYVLGVKPGRRREVVLGAYLHEVFRLVSRRVRRVLEDGVDGGGVLASVSVEEVVREAAAAVGMGEPDPLGALFAEWLLRQYAAEADQAAAVLGGDVADAVVPTLHEVPVDGRVLGLRPMRIDALAMGVVVEVKFSEPRPEHRLALAGYALGVEAEYEVPVDRGLLIYFSLGTRVRVRAVPVAIGDALRREFLAARDELAAIAYSRRDPGMPGTCSDRCLFRGFCEARAEARALA